MAEFDGIVEKVIENLLYFIHIGSDIQLISRKNQFDGDGFLFTGTFKGGSGIPDHAVDVKGGFLNKKHKVVLTVVPTREYYRVTEGIKTIDKDAFFVVTDSYEVVGGK